MKLSTGRDPRLKLSTGHDPRHKLAPAARGGVAVVEFAMLLPFISMLLLGILEMGRMLEVQQVLTNAAREGARQGAKNGSQDDVTKVVQDYLKNCGIETYTMNFESPSAGQPANSVTVTLNVAYADVSLLPARSLRWLENKTLIAAVTMRKE